MGLAVLFLLTAAWATFTALAIESTPLSFLALIAGEVVLLAIFFATNPTL